MPVAGNVLDADTLKVLDLLIRKLRLEVSLDVALRSGVFPKGHGSSVPPSRPDGLVRAVAAGAPLVARPPTVSPCGSALELEPGRAPGLVLVDEANEA